MGCCCSCTNKLEERVEQKFQGRHIIAKEIFWANLQYQRSAGCCQTQGNGALVLTPDVLWFNLLCPNKEIEMPLRNIRSAEVGPLRAPGHWAGYSVLIIDFGDAISRIEDQVMFALRDPPLWKRQIEEAIHNKTSF